MKHLFCHLAALLLATMTLAQAPYRYTAMPVWADEFDYEGRPDSTRWGYDVGGHGWGNKELQYYRDSGNAWVQQGVLRITARPQAWQGSAYTSARLVSKGKGDFLYGRFEARAKLPAGLGTWPAIWMLPTHWRYGNWPASGEIDIMEHVGYDPEKVHISVHTQAYNHIKGTQKTAFRQVPGALSDFHVYRVDWTPDYIEGFIDGQRLFRFDNERKTTAEWPFDQPFHWLLNLAVGGNWGGQKGVDAAVFPATMEVDYVRVYGLEQ
ncbi:MAG: glycoside hydrolase family 16 protein [Chitinophagaceae bacterium]|nr:glycoside hydrolase family 16 protein [Chitinophagaceae bacterium]